MYTACLFCSGALGSNPALDAFPVGRRLAFDAGRGRLWVVCPTCGRWNLTPLEERWEAIEQAERLYRGTRRRASTDEIGLARLADGTELIRVGRPLRPEFAAWRYGDQFGRRRRRQYVTYGGAAALAGALVVAGATAVPAMFAGLFFGLARRAYAAGRHGRPGQVVARVVDAEGAVRPIRRADLYHARLVAGGDGLPAVTLSRGDLHGTLGGDTARRALARILPAVNRAGGATSDVAHAVERIGRAGGPEALYRTMARRGPALTRVVTLADGATFADPDARHESGLLALPTSLALALEMAVHEETERRALDGELADLERAWREAEQIASVADALALPRGVEPALERIRRAQGGRPAGEL